MSSVRRICNETALRGTAERFRMMQDVFADCSHCMKRSERFILNVTNVTYCPIMDNVLIDVKPGINAKSLHIAMSID